MNSQNLKTKLFSGIAKEIYYRQSCLDPNDPKCTADEYFKEITYSVDLTSTQHKFIFNPIELYKVLGTCYNNDEMDYCPILIEIGEERIRKTYNNCPYLVQVWYKKQNKIYELPLQNKITLWAISYRYFIFVTKDEESEQGQECLKIVDLEQNNHIIKVKNFTSDQIKLIQYNDSKLYGASENKIFIASVPESNFKQSETIIDLSPSDISVIEPGLNVHGILMNEFTRDGKYIIIAFESHDNQLDFNRLYVENLGNKETFTFRYEQCREVIPRKDFQHDPITKTQFIFSQGFNYSVALRSSGKFDLYWNMTKKDSSIDKYCTDVGLSISGFFFKLTDQTQWHFDHEDKSSITFQQAKELVDEIDFSELHLKIVQNIVKIFSGFQLVRSNGKAFCVITHGKFFSTFDILEGKWANHVEFEDDIISLFRLFITSSDQTQCILLKNNAVYLKVFQYEEYQEPVPVENRSFKIEGEIIRTSEDVENSATFYLVIKKDDKIQLKCIQRSSIHDIGVVKPQENLSVVCLQYRGDESHILIQNGNKYMIYEQFSYNSGPNLKLLYTFYSNLITGHLHSGTGFNITKHIMVFDEKNFYVIKMKPDSVEVHKNVYCIGLQNFTRQFNYIICQDRSDAVTPGLRLFDMESIINKGKMNFTLLKKIDIGTQGYFEYGANINRFGFIQSLTNLLITPILHRNTNKFMGIEDADKYICYKVIKDKYIALTYSGELLTWNVLTGKPLSKHKLEQNYEDYELFSKYKKDCVLLKSKTTEEDVNTDEFFTSTQLQTSTQNQKPFVNNQEFSVRRWKYIEIKNEYEVTTHLEYTHPSYDTQWLFINKKKDMLIQRLVNWRVFLYKAVKISRSDESQIKWEIVRQITDFPAELDNDTSRIEIFTPDFSKYILLSRSKTNFIIKDTVSDQKLYTVPNEIMYVKQGQTPNHITNRFQWRDEETFDIISEDGIEKRVDITNNFNELQFNYRPLFNDIIGKEYEKCHYYVLREDIFVNSVLERLKRCYQQYKTSYFLHEKRLNSDLNQDLLTVDPHQIQFNNHSFTFLHWSIIEQLQNGTIKVSELEETVVEQLLYNILPGGNTILHKLCEREDELIQLFKIAHPKEDTIKYHVPFLPNLEGHSPIHKCIEKSDYKSIDTILKYLRVYNIDHHSRGIKDLFPVFIKQNLPEFLNYLDHRSLQTDQLTKFNKGCLKEDYPQILVSQLWLNETNLQDQIMTIKPVETRIECKIIDLPGIYHYKDEHFSDFFSELAKTEQTAYFKNASIQKLIEFNYPLVQEYVSKRLFYPFAVFMAFFFVLMNVVIEHKQDKNYNSYFYASYALLTINVLFAAYFLLNEIRQLGSAGIEYFGSFWNYIDIIPPIGIFAIATTELIQDLNIFHIRSDISRSIQAITTFFMWFKFLYFLRIYRSTGYLISMIFEVIKDMRYFFLVLLLTIVAFADSLLSISLGNAEDKMFALDFVDAIIYTYRMILGDFDTSEFGDVARPVVMVLFLLCTIFNMIVMLNLLIAIISESFAKVTSKSDQAVYQEMVSMIAENSYLIPDSRKKEYAVQDKYLLTVKDLEEMDDEAIDDPVLDKLEILEKQMKKQIIEMKEDAIKNQKKTDEAMKQINKQIIDDKKDIDIKLGEIKVMIVQQQGVVTINSKIHKHPLQKLTLSSLKEKHAKSRGYSTGFVCDGNKFVGCKTSEMIRANNDEELYHCEECGFDECAKCFEAFGDVHIHDLQKLTFTQLKELNPSYNEGWNCDLRYNTGCPHGGKTFNDEYGLVYHHAECGFDLCEKCAATYKLL